MTRHEGDRLDEREFLLGESSEFLVGESFVKLFLEPQPVAVLAGVVEDEERIRRIGADRGDPVAEGRAHGTPRRAGRCRLVPGPAGGIGGICAPQGPLRRGDPPRRPPRRVGPPRRGPPSTSAVTGSGRSTGSGSAAAPIGWTVGGSETGSPASSREALAVGTEPELIATARAPTTASTARVASVGRHLIRRRPAPWRPSQIRGPRVPTRTDRPR